MKAILTILLAVPLTVAGCKKHNGEGVPKADNTERNRNDPNNAVTADQGAQRGDDLELTQHVRQAIVRDDALSMNAHNLKIIVDHGVVTLAGPVASVEERGKVETIAMAVPGTAKVVNKTEVKN